MTRVRAVVCRGPNAESAEPRGLGAIWASQCMLLACRFALHNAFCAVHFRNKTCVLKMLCQAMPSIIMTWFVLSACRSRRIRCLFLLSSYLLLLFHLCRANSYSSSQTSRNATGGCNSALYAFLTETEHGLQEFAEHLQREFSIENLLFWQAVEQYHRYELQFIRVFLFWLFLLRIASMLGLRGRTLHELVDVFSCVLSMCTQ